MSKASKKAAAEKAETNKGTNENEAAETKGEKNAPEGGGQDEGTLGADHDLVEGESEKRTLGPEFNAIGCPAQYRARGKGECGQNGEDICAALVSAAKDDGKTVDLKVFPNGRDAYDAVNVAMVKVDQLADLQPGEATVALWWTARND